MMGVPVPDGQVELSMDELVRVNNRGAGAGPFGLE